VTREVTYGDLTLTSAADRQKLVRRVAAAVNQVCNQAVGFNDESTHLWCTSDAWGRAWPQVARAERRASEIEKTGASSIAATAVTIKAIG
jgi:UrcA family protein